MTLAKVFARRSVQLGPEEIVFPPKGIQLLEGQPVTVTEPEGEAILLKFGMKGVIRIPDEATPDQIPELLLTAQRIRYNFLRKQLDAYRMEQGNRQATNVPIMMPTDSLRSKFNEAKALRETLIAQDPVIQETLTALPGEKREMAEPDTLAEELRAFGISPKAAPLEPGITAWDQGVPV